MNILITGINGFIATHLKLHFEKLNHHVFGISQTLDTNQDSKIFNLTLPNKDIYSIVGEISPDVVIHAAGTASVPNSVINPYTDFDVSVPATAMLLDAIRQHAPNSHLIFLSSAAVYGNPTKLPISEADQIKPISPYGYHKRMGELLCEEYSKIYGLKTTVLRIFSAYGRGLQRQVVYDLTKKCIKASHSRVAIDVIGTGNESRDFIHVSDIVRAIELVMKAPSNHQVLNLASGVEISIKTLIRNISEVIERDVPVVYSNQTRKGDPINWVADISKLASLGFAQTVGLKKGLEDISNWIFEDEITD